MSFSSHPPPLHAVLWCSFEQQHCLHLRCSWEVRALPGWPCSQCTEQDHQLQHQILFTPKWGKLQTRMMHFELPRLLLPPCLLSTSFTLYRSLSLFFPSFLIFLSHPSPISPLFLSSSLLPLPFHHPLHSLPLLLESLLYLPSLCIAIGPEYFYPSVSVWLRLPSWIWIWWWNTDLRLSERP